MNDSLLAHAATASAARTTPSSERLDSVDILRGLVMVLMALDHIRGFLHFGAVHGFAPLDLKTTTASIFLTRWITHYCAPVFIFLAGTGAFLSSTRGRSRRDLSWFLVTRGLWLILLELTFITWAGWRFGFDLHVSVGAVIWVIGWSMIVLAGLIHLPMWAVLTVSGLMIAGHNAFDGVKPESWGALGWLWRVLHAGGGMEFAPGFQLIIAYPLIPWAGVMAAGYAFGRVLVRPREERRPIILRLGLALTVGFILLRFSNLYGNPRPWTTQANPVFTVLAFLDCHKYPPSLCYLLMTLGPALIVLAWIDREETPAALKPLRVFGRVPLFYYLLHIPLVHAIAVIVETLRFGSAPWLLGAPFVSGHVRPPPNAGLGLPALYAAWITAILVLYPLCRWFSELKRRRRDAWLSYL